MSETIHPRPSGRRWFRLTQEGWYWLFAACALLTTGLFKGINLITLLGCLMLVAWGLGILTSRKVLRHLRGRRFVEEPVFAGRPFVLEVEVQNLRPWTQAALVLEDGDPDERLRWPVPLLEARASRRLHRAIVCRRRGKGVIGPLTAATGLPFGLVRRTQTLVPPQEVMVLPALGRLHRGRLRRWLAQTALTLGRAAQQARRHPAAQAEVHGLRPFRSGDSPRWIHWRTTARKRELMVREFEERPTDNLIVVVDPGMRSAAPEARNRRQAEALEDVISLAATICWEWCRQAGDWLVLAVAGSEPAVLGGGTRRELALEMLRVLAVLERDGPTDPAALNARLAATPLPSAPVLVLSAGPSTVPEIVMETLRRPVAWLDLAEGPGGDFFERAANHAR
jgi:uncharacterized protein (DUF58 family)